MIVNYLSVFFFTFSSQGIMGLFFSERGRNILCAGGYKFVYVDNKSGNWHCKKRNAEFV